MIFEDGELGVVFNGMIYNFLELRQELESTGCRFRSRTDTEVLLHGYREWGADQPATKLQGMFAVGICDETAGKSYLIRDRLGVKPLVFSNKGGEIVFASTVPPFIQFTAATLFGRSNGISRIRFSNR